MSDEIGVFITGDRSLSLKFDQFPEVLRGKLKKEIVELTAEMYAEIEALVPRSTGRLAGEIVQSVRDTETAVVGRVSVSGEFAKAGALEYGAHKSTKVRAHQMRLSHAWARQISPIEVLVKEFSRTPDIAEHRFMRGPAVAMRGRVFAALEGVVDATLSEDL